MPVLMVLYIDPMTMYRTTLKSEGNETVHSSVFEENEATATAHKKRLSYMAATRESIGGADCSVFESAARVTEHRMEERKADDVTSTGSKR